MKIIQQITKKVSKSKLNKRFNDNVSPIEKVHSYREYTARDNKKKAGHRSRERNPGYRKKRAIEK